MKDERLKIWKAELYRLKYIEEVYRILVKNFVIEGGDHGGP